MFHTRYGIETWLARSECIANCVEINVTSNKLFSNTDTYYRPRQLVMVSVTQCNTTYLTTIDCSNEQLAYTIITTAKTWESTLN